jgi:hypothetical protein
MSSEKNQVEATEAEELDTEDTEDDTPSMPVFDTREATRNKPFVLDGVQYHLRPLSSDDYFKVVSKNQAIQSLQAQGENAKTVKKMQDTMFAIIVPMITPADKFSEWQSQVKHLAAYRTVMTDLMQYAVPNIRKDK